MEEGLTIEYVNVKKRIFKIVQKWYKLGLSDFKCLLNILRKKYLLFPRYLFFNGIIHAYFLLLHANLYEYSANLKLKFS